MNKERNNFSERQSRRMNLSLGKNDKPSQMNRVKNIAYHNNKGTPPPPTQSHGEAAAVEKTTNDNSGKRRPLSSRPSHSERDSVAVCMHYLWRNRTCSVCVCKRRRRRSLCSWPLRRAARLRQHTASRLISIDFRRFLCACFFQRFIQGGARRTLETCTYA